MSNEHITDEQIAGMAKARGIHDRGAAVDLVRAILAMRHAAQTAGEPFGWWFTEDPDVFCMPGSGFRRFPNKPQHTVECIALYTTPQPVAVPDRVPMTQSDVVSAFCKLPHETQYVSVFNAGVRAAEAHHGITTPKADK